MLKKITIQLQGDSLIDDLIIYERILNYIKKLEKVKLITKQIKREVWNELYETNLFWN